MRPLAAVALAAVSSWGLAQPYGGSPSGPGPRPATIQVTGEAQVSETPDRVYIDIGVSTQAPKSETAAAQNAERLSAVIAAVKRAGGAGAQLATTEYSISPNYRYPRNGAATVVGYTVSNVVQVRLDDLQRIGRVIDAATEAGSNNVQNIRFALRDEQAARDEALRQAALKARRDVETLADALDLKVVRVLTVNEEGPAMAPVYPRMALRMEAQAAPATPVEAGTLDISATVTLTVEVAPAKR
jgi:hypothetical protein